MLHQQFEWLLERGTETSKYMQIIKFIERILYATDETEAKEAMLEAQNLYADPAA